MEDIISQIIKIDQQAQEKIDSLNEAKELHRLEFEVGLKQNNAILQEKAKQRIDSFAKQEDDFLQSEKISLDEELQSRIKKLVDLHEYEHDKIERTIFKSIISPSV